MDFIPNINDVMSKKQQVAALLDEALALTDIPAGKKTHTKKQEKAVKKDIARFFPNLREYL